MSAKIIPKKSTVADKIPTAGSLAAGEIAVNFTDGRIYGKHPSDNSIVKLSGADELHTHQASQITGLGSAATANTSDFVPSNASVTAGNGLSGGGNVSSNPTISLATPGTITASSTNEVTADSHTHAIEITPADIGLGEATPSSTGLMSASDKSKLDNIQPSPNITVSEDPPSGGNVGDFWYRV